MSTIKFLTPEGQAHNVEAEDGLSVMEAAVSNNIAGIEASCGGACACATCHVYVDAAWLDRLPERTDMETKMLDFATGLQANSRLCCRLIAGPELDGLVLTVPAAQY